MAMQDVPEEIFMDGLVELLRLDQNWIPSGDGRSLYIRPFLIATDNYIGVKPSDSYMFLIITTPVGAYYDHPLKVKVEKTYFRAVEGGVGFVKASGNYGRSLYPTSLAKKDGYDQLIWTDAREHKYVEESGTMNLMFVINNVLITPKLGDTILAGITRDSVLQLARDWNFPVEERKISVDEIIAAYENGTLQEAFGTGTAATGGQQRGAGSRRQRSTTASTGKAPPAPVDPPEVPSRSARSPASADSSACGGAYPAVTTT
jgi:branched-chain amino acid aminotransferase